jgi:hypothetical protein
VHLGTWCKAWRFNDESDPIQYRSQHKEKIILTLKNGKEDIVQAHCDKCQNYHNGKERLLTPNTPDS